MNKNVLIRAAQQMWPSSPNFFELVNEQCDMAVKIMDGLIAYMESTDKDKGRHISKLEKQGDELKRRNLEILNTAFSTPMDREDIYRAIVDVDHVMDYAKTTVREIFLFGVKPDKYILQMTEHLREGTTALQMGFRLLKEAPIAAEAEAQKARKSERNVEKVYRSALTELFDIKNYTKAIQAAKNDSDTGIDDDYLAVEHVMETFKRREVYRHLSNAADRLARAGNTLHDIIVKLV